jgi:hypothetical protein
MTDTQTWRNMLTDPDVDGVTDVQSRDSIAIQPQYAHSPRIKALAAAFQDEIDASPELAELFDKVANVHTAIGIYLDWLGARVGVSRHLVTHSGSVTLGDENFRFLILLKALANISTGDVATINDLLGRLLDVPVWTMDRQDMTIDVFIFGKMTAEQRAILEVYGIPCRPAGVRANVYHFSEGNNYFGFNGSNLQPFNQAIFFNQG